MSIPKTLDFQSVKPQGLPNQLKFQKFYPQAYNNNIQFTDQIRFIINQQGFWDPYNTYIVIEVDTSNMDTETIQQLDGSAHAFISELVISVGNKEIERIQEYDQLAQMLYDVHFSHEGRDQRLHEGVGSLSTLNNDFQQPMQPRLNVGYATATSVYGVGSQGWNAQQATPPINYTQDGCSTYVNPVFASALDAWAAYAYQTPGSNLGLLLNSGAADDLTTKGQLSQFLMRVDNDIVTQRKTSPTFNQQQYYTSTGTVTDCMKINYFCGTSNEPIFTKKTTWNSKAVQPTIISNGKFNQRQNITKMRFQIPLLSAIFGVLLPRESFKYIPLKYFKDLTLDFRLNPYALFTSGYKDKTGATETGTYDKWSAFSALGSMQSRNYSLTKFEIWTDIMVFDSGVESAIDQQFNSGITFYSQAFQLGPLYQLSNTTNCQGTFQVNQGFESLKSIIIRYMLNDYQTYSFCRKSMYLSSNITFLQARIGLDYYPQLPIEGHAGCPIPNTNGQCNADYLVQMLKCFGKLHDIDQNIYINIHNMAPNQRCYDVTNTNAYATVAGNSGARTVTITNSDTARGFPLQYENLCVSKALFGINTEGLSNDNTRISGINTMGTRPFDIIVKTDSATVNATYDRPRTMYIWMHYDFLLRMSPSGFEVLGRS